LDIHVGSRYFAVELGIGELSELTTKVLTGTDHKVFLTNFNLSLLPCKETKLPTETVAEGMAVWLQALDFFLGV